MSDRGVTTPEAWSLVKEIVWAVRELPSDERERVISDRAGDERMRDRVRALLRAIDDVGDRFQRPAIETLSAGELVRHSERGWAESPGLVGRTLGAYTVTRRVGSGGMGAVYEGARHDGDFDQRVAIKTLWRGADSDVLSQRFRSERRILASLEHPNIARLIDGGATVEGTPYLVMEFVDGTPIDRYSDERRLAIPQRLDLFRQACAAVQHAHRHLIVHRDLKPSNILVAHDGQVKLLDFGVAKLLDDPRDSGTLTDAGFAPFTRAYAAPEQLAGGAISTATDVYALGAVLHVLLCGHEPGRRDGASDAPRPPSAFATDAAAHARARADAQSLARALRGDLDAIALTALRAEPERRYASVDALSEDVRRYLRGHRVLARPDTLGYRVRVFARRRRGAVAAVAFALVALAAGATAAIWQARQSEAEAVRAERIAKFMTRMFGTPDGHTGSSFMRLGPRGSIASLLDSALARVAADFPEDPRIRARLYTEIGSSYIAEGRMRDAAQVLDSARALARASYGAGSDAYAEASTDAANAAIHRSPPAVAVRYATDALAALHGREPQARELYDRALATLASAWYLDGEVDRADTLARRVIALELQRTPAPTMTRGWAVRIAAGVAAMRDDPRGADTLAAHSVAIVDSAGGQYSLELIDALDERANAVASLGEFARADSLAVAGLSVARDAYGPRSRETALFLSSLSLLARVRHDTAAARAMAGDALAIIDSIPEVNGPARLAGAYAEFTQRLVDSRFAAADTLATTLFTRIESLDTPPATSTAARMIADARFYRGDVAGAERYARLALSSYSRDSRRELLPALARSQLAVILAAEKRRAAADSALALLSPRRAAAVRPAIASLLSGSQTK